MWVQTETHIIDFMAPLFPEAFSSIMGETIIHRKMLQRSISSEAKDLDSLSVAGDFITLPSRELTTSLLQRFLKRPANSDLIHVADAWFGSANGKQRTTFDMVNDLGEVTNLKLSPYAASGSW